MKPHILNTERDTLEAWLKAEGQPVFRTNQVLDWIYEKKVFELEGLRNIPKDLRAKLAEAFDWSVPEIIERLDGKDGSTKLLLRSSKGQMIETVILRYENRVSLCVSSQVGCKLACSFCQTGKLGFVRHLEQAEIIAQYLVAQKIVRTEDDRRISHIVFMGMGEPFDNYANAVGAANAFIDAFGLSARHVTLSTSGMVPKIYDFTQDCRAALAISLHASTDELRTQLMPINRKYPLAKLKESLINYQRETGKVVTIEYILIHGINCGVQEAKALIKFLHGLKAKVNLIPFNPHPGLPYERPSPGEIETFQKYLSSRSYAAPVRYSKGLDVSAACGQLAAKKLEDLAAVPARKRLLDQPMQSLHNEA